MVISSMRGGTSDRVFTYFNINTFDLYRIRVQSSQLTCFEAFQDRDEACGMLCELLALLMFLFLYKRATRIYCMSFTTVLDLDCAVFYDIGVVGLPVSIESFLFASTSDAFIMHSGEPFRTKGAFQESYNSWHGVNMLIGIENWGMRIIFSSAFFL